jgi:hypothetical protein
VCVVVDHIAVESVDVNAARLLCRQRIAEDRVSELLVQQVLVSDEPLVLDKVHGRIGPAEGTTRLGRRSR